MKVKFVTADGLVSYDEIDDNDSNYEYLYRMVRPPMSACRYWEDNQIPVNSVMSRRTYRREYGWLNSLTYVEVFEDTVDDKTSFIIENKSLKKKLNDAEVLNKELKSRIVLLEERLAQVSVEDYDAER